MAGDRDELIYRVALSLGLRQGGILGLAWDAVELDAETIMVRRTLQRYDGAFHHDEPKTPKSRRTIAVPTPLMAAMRQHRTRQREERLRVGPAWIGNEFDLVFTREDGRPISNSTITKRFQTTLARHGLPLRRFHDLRHSSASFMLAEGVPLRVISEVLGYADTAITGRVYGHVQPELQRDATARVDSLLRAAQ